MVYPAGEDQRDGAAGSALFEAVNERRAFAGGQQGMSHSCMMEEKDGKCYIDSRSPYARELESQFREGHIPSFPELFSHTTCGPLTTEEKRGKHII